MYAKGKWWYNTEYGHNKKRGPDHINLKFKYWGANQTKCGAK